MGIELAAIGRQVVAVALTNCTMADFGECVEMAISMYTAFTRYLLSHPIQSPRISI